MYYEDFLNSKAEYFVNENEYALGFSTKDEIIGYMEYEGEETLEFLREATELEVEFFEKHGDYIYEGKFVQYGEEFIYRNKDKIVSIDELLEDIKKEDEGLVYLDKSSDLVYSAESIVNVLLDCVDRHKDEESKEEMRMEIDEFLENLVPLCTLKRFTGCLEEIEAPHNHDELIEELI